MYIFFNFALQASDDDFKIVKRNRKCYFQSRHMLQFWKCKYMQVPNKWRCVEEGMMMAIFNLDGHFLYDESIQATEEKMNLILCTLEEV